MEYDESPTMQSNSSSSLEDQHVCEVPDSYTDLRSVTTVLYYCKRKILNPYMRFLGFMGIRPLCESQDSCTCLKLILTRSYTVLIISLLIVGYLLQYMACFRRERGFCYVTRTGRLTLSREIDDVYDRSCYGSVAFSSILPSLMHLVAYLHMVYVFRSTDDEYLPILMEKVFVISTNLSAGTMSQKRLVKMLWVFVIFSIVWMSLSIFAVICMMCDGDIHFKWMMRSSLPLIFMKILLVSCTLGHDVVQATVISNYCLQAQLLTSYVQFLREKLLQFPVIPLEWMRDIEDFKKLLNYFNHNIAPPACLLVVVDISFAVSGIIWILGFDHIDTETLPIFGLSILNIILWIFMASVPFVQAARLSNSCEVLKTVGQEARTRPYVHQNTPTTELDSVLLYTSSLQISAKLFYIPITLRKLCFCLTVSSIVILILGQCHYLISK
nr:uncharacterized protein LOC111508285 isoform X2 [Leptinotarsa decemlineata]XP_023019499.1 uncharacterized protein LOC111508285 isoform X2 [Leptinotarsa decemlineata]